MVFTDDLKMADVIHQNYLLLPVIKRFGIQLGFGDKSIKQVCKDYNINIDFFLEIINSYHDPDYLPRKDIGSFSVLLIINYLSSTHHYYLHEKLPGLGKLIDSLIECCDTKNKEFLLIKDFFDEYLYELEVHVKNEEEVIYPYCLKVENAFISGNYPPGLLDVVKTRSILEFEKNHTDVESKLFDLKNIIIKYLPPAKDINLCHTILMELFRLERDLNNHSEIEEKVLIPKIAGMEKSIISSVIG